MLDYRLSQHRWSQASSRRNVLMSHWEPIQPYVLSACIADISEVTFIDVGANYGLYTVLMGVLPQVRSVHAFEPVPTAFRELESNVQLNCIQHKVNLHRSALSRSPGFSKFRVFSDLAGANSLEGTYLHTSREPRAVIDVRLETLDSLIIDPPGRLAIKIDVEGHELAVIEGGTRVLASSSAVLQIELHDQHPDAASTTAILADLGFKQFLSVGPDRYFSNFPGLQTSAEVLKKVSYAMAEFVDDQIKDYSLNRSNSSLAGSSAMWRKSAPYKAWRWLRKRGFL